MVVIGQALGQAAQSVTTFQAAQILQSLQTAVTSAVTTSLQIIQQAGSFRNSMKFVMFEGYVSFFFV